MDRTGILLGLYTKVERLAGQVSGARTRSSREIDQLDQKITDVDITDPSSLSNRERLIAALFVQDELEGVGGIVESISTDLFRIALSEVDVIFARPPSVQRLREADQLAQRIEIRMAAASGLGVGEAAAIRAELAALRRILNELCGEDA